MRKGFYPSKGSIPPLYDWTRYARWSLRREGNILEPVRTTIQGPVIVFFTTAKPICVVWK